MKPKRLFIIGRLLNDNDKVEAYKVYQDETKEIKIISRTKVWNLARTCNTGDIVVVGLRKRGDLVGSDGLPLFGENNYLYATKETDVVNGFGEVISGDRKWHLIDVEGFREASEYTVIDSMGNEKTFNFEDFKKLVAEDRIIGARIDGRSLRIYKYCDMRNF